MDATNSSGESAAACTLMRYCIGEGFGVGKVASKVTFGIDVVEVVTPLVSEVFICVADGGGLKYSARMVEGTKDCSCIVADAGFAGFIVIGTSIRAPAVLLRCEYPTGRSDEIKPVLHDIKVPQRARRGYRS